MKFTVDKDNSDKIHLTNSSLTMYFYLSVLHQNHEKIRFLVSFFATNYPVDNTHQIDKVTDAIYRYVFGKSESHFLKRHQQFLDEKALKTADALDDYYTVLESF